MPNLTFKKIERINSRKDIEALVKEGVRANERGIQMTSLIFQEMRKPAIRVLFSAPKRKFKKAVDRNLLKRRMREAYRLNKYQCNKWFEDSNKSADLMFVYTSNEVLSYAEIENKIVLLLKGLFPSDEINS